MSSSKSTISEWVNLMASRRLGYGSHERNAVQETLIESSLRWWNFAKTMSCLHFHQVYHYDYGYVMIIGLVLQAAERRWRQRTWPNCTADGRLPPRVNFLKVNPLVTATEFHPHDLIVLWVGGSKNGNAEWNLGWTPCHVNFVQWNSLYIRYSVLKLIQIPTDS